MLQGGHKLIGGCGSLLDIQGLIQHVDAGLLQGLRIGAHGG
jgi:hypothetical protein